MEKAQTNVYYLNLNGTIILMAAYTFKTPLNTYYLPSVIIFGISMVVHEKFQTLKKNV